MAFSLFKKKKQKNDDRYLDVKVKEIVNIAKDAVNLVFEVPESFSYQPGQFITIIREVKGKKIRRAYSLCTSPEIDEFPAVTVKRVEGGLMSNELNDQLKVGETLQIMEPMGMFTTEYAVENHRKTVFFGGGSGITPLMAILKTILKEEPKSEVALVYGNQSEEYIIFSDLLKELSKQYADRLKVIHVLEEGGTAPFTGRPDAAMIQDICKELDCDAQTEFFICGPQPMMDVVTNGLGAAGFSDEQVMLESFEAGKTSPEEIIDKDTGESEVTIHLDGEVFEVTVKKTAAILDTALNKELDMPYSCQSGLCTACRAKCVEGSISIDEAEGLSQDELDEGYVLTCVGKPLTDRVKIEVG